MKITLPIRPCPGGGEETDSPEHSHPDTREWVLDGRSRNAQISEANRLRKPICRSAWKHCSTCA